MTRLFVITLASVGLGSFFIKVWEQLNIPNYYGSVRAPHSDALVPWLHGSLSYYFDNVPTHGLYRPTVGLFYSSLLSSWGSFHIHWLPTFFALLLLAFLIFFFVNVRAAMSVPVALWLLWSALNFKGAVAPLYIGSLNIDFLSFVATVVGLLFVVHAFDTKPSSLPEACVGFSLLGIAAAIRGPLMLSGLALLAGAGFFLGRNKQWWCVPVVFVCFLLPLLVEWFIQNSYGTVNNGLICLFCVYSDPRHTWTPGGNDFYNLWQPSASEVLTRYTSFLFSTEGILVIFVRFAERLKSDLSLLISPASIGILVLAFVFLSLQTQNWSAAFLPSHWKSGVKLQSVGHWLWARRASFARTAVPVALVILIALLPGFRVPLAIIFLFWLVAVSFWLGLHCALACLTMYVLSLLFLCLVGLAWLSRLTSTISFGLVLGFYFFLLENKAGNSVAKRRSFVIASTLTALVVIWLYAGNFLVETHFKKAFAEQVRGRSAAMKISDDPQLDRSLYYTGHNQLLYTTLDSVPVGAVRRYESVLTRFGWPVAPSLASFNESFKNPVIFHGE